MPKLTSAALRGLSPGLVLLLREMRLDREDLTRVGEVS